MSRIFELIELQRRYNEWWKNATPAERARDARATLRYIGEVEESAPDWYREIEVESAPPHPEEAG